MNNIVKPVIDWMVYVVGKPAYDYSQVEMRYTGELLSWNFAEMDRAYLIARIARVSKYISALEKWVEAGKEILKSDAPNLGLKLGDTKEVPGIGWIATYAFRSRMGLDSEAIKTEMGDQWYAAHCKETQYYEIRFKEIK